MATGYHDDSNNPRNNLVVHPAGTDAERGIPAVGKMVYRTDTGALEVCNDTTPDPTLNGGGTWSGTGGTAWTAYTPVLSSSGTPVNIGATGYELGRYATIGKTCNVQVHIGFSGAGLDPGTGAYKFELPLQHGSSAENTIIGHGAVYDSSTGYFYLVAVFGYSTSNSTEAKMYYTNLQVTFAQPFTWAASDTISCWLSYEID